MNNILNGSVTSIERMAEVISKRKKQDVNATYDGPSFTEILSRHQRTGRLSILSLRSIAFARLLFLLIAMSLFLQYNVYSHS